jgi:hypothetical protein
MLDSLFHKKRNSYDLRQDGLLCYSSFSGNDPFNVLLARNNKLKLDSHKKESIRKIQNYSIPEIHINKLKEEPPFIHMNVTDINEYIIEFKKYLAIIVLIQGHDKTQYVKIAMMNNLVDEIWHNFILFTEEYNKFSVSIFGKYLHHYPFTNSEPTLIDDSKKKFLFYYKKYFGEINPIWKFKYNRNGTIKIQHNYKTPNYDNYPIFHHVSKNNINENFYFGFFTYSFTTSNNLEYDLENDDYWNGYWNGLNAYSFINVFEDTLRSDDTGTDADAGISGGGENGCSGCGGCGGCGG